MSVIHTAEILSIGTELLLGETLDTNSTFLAASLAEHGVDVYWSQRVGDNLERIVDSLTGALARSDLVVTSGGLGPTDDDLTREAIAAVTRETPTVEPALEEELRARFATLTRAMPEKNLKQAWLIPSAEALPNPRGTAPGWLVRIPCENRTKVVAALPGPPRELTYMWHQQVLSRLKLPASSLHVKLYKTFGLGESAVAERLERLTSGSNPSVATYAKGDGVHVRVAAKAVNEAEAQALAAPAEKAVEKALGGVIWGTGEEQLAQLVIDRLRNREWSLACLEEASSGMIGQQLAAAAGSRSVYRGGMIAWSLAAVDMLGIAKDRPAASEGGDQGLAKALAEAVRQRFQADVGLAAITVSAEDNDVDNDHRPLGKYVALGVVTIQGSTEKKLRLPFSDEPSNRERIALAALHLLWSSLR